MSLIDEDLELAFDLYQRIASGGEDEHMTYFVIPGAPPSKARHRSTRSGRTYRDPKDAAAEHRTATFMRQAVGAPFEGNVALGCVFFRPSRQRIDTDNMIKHVCDAANGVLWRDDSQVTAVIGITELDPGNPRTIVVIGRHVTSMTRGADAVYPCVVCDAPISMIGQTKHRATCSTACAVQARGYNPLDSLVPCTQCGQPFRRATKTQVLCSIVCRQASLRDVRKGAGRPFSQCIDCGCTLAHKRGGRCRDCWRITATAKP